MTAEGLDGFAAVYHPGEFKAERMVKQEDILNGDSVLYADPLAYEMALKGVFAPEQAQSSGRFIRSTRATRAPSPCSRRSI